MFTYAKDNQVLSILEGYSDVFRYEYAQLSAGKFRSWPESFKYDGSWKAFGFYTEGRKLKVPSSMCPLTVEYLEGLGRIVQAGFSKLAAGAVIKPHIDEVPKGIKRIHVGIDVPFGDCRFRVGSETVAWENGKAFMFDPYVEHEVWNRTAHDRVILLLDYAEIHNDFFDVEVVGGD